MEFKNVMWNEAKDLFTTAIGNFELVDVAINSSLGQRKFGVGVINHQGNLEIVKGIADKSVLVDSVEKYFEALMNTATEKSDKSTNADSSDQSAVSNEVVDAQEVLAAE